MSKTEIESLMGGDVVDQVCLAQETNLRTTKRGSFYLQVELRDKTGVIPGRMWDVNPTFAQTISDGDFVWIKGRVELYRGDRQVIIDNLRKLDEDEIDPRDFLPATSRDVDEMMKRLEALALSVKDQWLRQLLEAAFADEEIREGYRSGPAAVRYHHAFLGGLLEHTLSVSEMAAWLAEHREEFNGDLLIAGAVLHDIGKIRELSYSRMFGYTDEGQLIGHLVIGARMIEDLTNTLPGFPRELQLTLRHLILSHHGEYEYGSPKLPMTVEAIALHHIDNLDAKVQAFAAAVDDLGSDGGWTNWSSMFDRRLYRSPDRESD